MTRATDPDQVGKRTTNVAPVSASVFAAWQVPGANGLQWLNRVTFSGRKPVTRDNAVELHADVVSIICGIGSVVCRHRDGGELEFTVGRGVPDAGRPSAHTASLDSIEQHGGAAVTGRA